MKSLFIFFFLTVFSPFAFAQNEPIAPDAVAAPESTSTPPAAPRKDEWDAGNKPTPSLEVARFRWWAPESARDLRGIMLIIPGRHGDARGAVNDPTWRAFAEKVRFALIGLQLDHPDGAYQNDPNGETSQLIEKAVEKLAVDNGYPQLKNGPFASWGHSAGSNTEAAFSARNPKRCVAIVSIKGPNGPGAYSKEKGDVAYLICTGGKDKAEWVKESGDNYATAREKKATWTQALNPNEGHEEGKTKALAILFLTNTINLRMDPPSESAPFSSHLKDINYNSGWLADPKTLEIASYLDYKGKKKEAIWIPDEETAKAWKVYMQP